MCGRFTLRKPKLNITDWLGIGPVLGDDELPIYRIGPRYNIVPAEHIIVIRNEGAGLQLIPMKWGLVPAWAKDSSIGNRMINARCETVFEKPSFRSAIRRRRCIIPADGFYEWKRSTARNKYPYYITHADSSLFGFAGVWEQWNDPKHGPLKTCTILTTEPNQLMAEIHHRMPVILPRAAHDIWLDHTLTGPDEITDLFEPYPASKIVARPVSTYVNTPGHDTPRCIESIDEQDNLF